VVVSGLVVVGSFLESVGEAAFGHSRVATVSAAFVAALEDFGEGFTDSGG